MNSELETKKMIKLKLKQKVTQVKQIPNLLI